MSTIPTPPTGTEDTAMVDTLVKAARSGMDFPGYLAAILARAAARLGSTEALLAGRPGSWEASHLRALLTGTVGEGDEYLYTYDDARLGHD